MAWIRLAFASTCIIPGLLDLNFRLLVVFCSMRFRGRYRECWPSASGRHSWPRTSFGTVWAAGEWQYSAALGPFCALDTVAQLVVVLNFVQYVAVVANGRRLAAESLSGRQRHHVNSFGHCLWQRRPFVLLSTLHPRSLPCSLWLPLSLASPQTRTPPPSAQQVQLHLAGHS